MAGFSHANLVVNGDGLTVQDVIEVGRGDARAEWPRRARADGGEPDVVTAAIAGDSAGLRGQHRVRRAGRHPGGGSMT